MERLSVGFLLIAAFLLIVACGNSTTDEGGGAAAHTEPAPAKTPVTPETPETPPPPAKAEIKCVEDTNKRTNKAGEFTIGETKDYLKERGVEVRL